MKEQQANQATQGEPAQPAAKQRLPYETPAVLSEEVFETLALSCTTNVICGPGASS